ncbi:MAG: TetR family transcriptional regulator [Gammaproteobacteria bacterium]|nr:TetR family transcriptional regulator [Gammaproteobacteria bacterium]
MSVCLRYRGTGSLLLAVAVVWNSAPAAEQHRLNGNNLVLEDIPAIPPQLVLDLNRYQNVRSAFLQGWSHAGDSIYITTRFADVTQLHRVDQAAGARRQLTFFKEPIREVRVNPASASLAFTMDTGGSEFTQIYLLDNQTGEHRLISDGKSRNDTLLWSRDGVQLAYQSTRRNGAANDIWIASFSEDGTAAHAMVTAAPDGASWYPRAFSAAGDKLLVGQYISSTHALVHLQDLRSGDLRLLAGDHTMESSNYPVDYNQRGDGVFLITDRYGDFTELVYLDIDSGRETRITADIHWDVELAVVSNDKKRAAFAVNEAGVSRLYLLDPETLRYTLLPDLPSGVIGDLAFNAAGNKLALSLSTPIAPADVYVLTLVTVPTESQGYQRWTYSEVGGLNPATFRAPELIHYPGFDTTGDKQREIPAFIYRPAGTGPFPVIITIHGGPESQYRPDFSSNVQLWLSKLGAAVIAPNVRGSSGYGKQYLALDNAYQREDSVRDIGALLDWIGTQPDLDAKRVAVHGGSYGGYMVLASAVHYSERLRAAVDIVGISNFVTFLENTQDYRRDLRRVEYGDERDPAMRAYLDNISPSNQVEKINIPLLVIQGQNDPRVPVTESEQIVSALRTRGNQVWYMNALNEGHGYAKKENNNIAGQVIFMFLQQHLLQ